jgi:hypothetical protein
MSAMRMPARRNPDTTRRVSGEQSVAMNQIVVAIFDGQSSADAAVQDLEGARIPSVVIKRYAAADAEERITPTGFEGHPEGCPLVTVSVDDAHAEAVTGILKQHGSVPAR